MIFFTPLAKKRKRKIQKNNILFAVYNFRSRSSTVHCTKTSYMRYTVLVHRQKPCMLCCCFFYVINSMIVVVHGSHERKSTIHYTEYTNAYVCNVYFKERSTEHKHWFWLNKTKTHFSVNFYIEYISLKG